MKKKQKITRKEGNKSSRCVGTLTSRNQNCKSGDTQTSKELFLKTVKCRNMKNIRRTQVFVLSFTNTRNFFVRFFLSLSLSWWGILKRTCCCCSFTQVSGALKKVGYSFWKCKTCTRSSFFQFGIVFFWNNFFIDRDMSGEKKIYCWAARTNQGKESITKSVDKTRTFLTWMRSKSKMR